ncbi:phosphatase PAP2 family protein [Jatrophihabitans sp.]|uniref:phosphatase PAP2 family protein n=1 Tax=Jatrophihabitans sp. TaxID=1932789 RepID=UPI002C8E8AD2|nr:phosphatase PAP2 family protein [Jatrophihabitans sp.]
MIGSRRRRTGETAAERREQAGRRRFAGRALLVFLIGLLAAALFVAVLLLVAAQAEFVIRTDHSVAADLHHYALRHPAFTRAMRWLSDLHKTVVWFVVMALVAGWLLVRRLRRLALFVVVTVLGSSLLNNVVKLLVNRARPHLSDPVAVAGGKSFPSGHAQAAIVGYGVLLAVFLPIIPRRWRSVAIAAAALMVLLVGFARISLGVHYLFDVIGAFLIGTVWLIGMASAFRTWRREEGKPVADLDEGLEPEHRERLKP